MTETADRSEGLALNIHTYIVLTLFGTMFFKTLYNLYHSWCILNLISCVSSDDSFWKHGPQVLRSGSVVSQRGFIHAQPSCYLSGGTERLTVPCASVRLPLCILQRPMGQCLSHTHSGPGPVSHSPGHGLPHQHSAEISQQPRRA